MFVNIIVNKPTIELINLTEGYNYVEYSLYLDNINENETYYATISNSFEYYEFELFYGENSYKLGNLSANSVYVLSVFGKDIENGSQTEYFSKTFFC